MSGPSPDGGGAGGGMSLHRAGDPLGTEDIIVLTVAALDIVVAAVTFRKLLRMPAILSTALLRAVCVLVAVSVLINELWIYVPGLAVQWVATLNAIPILVTVVVFSTAELEFLRSLSAFAKGVSARAITAAETFVLLGGLAHVFSGFVPIYLGSWIRFAETMWVIYPAFVSGMDTLQHAYLLYYVFSHLKDATTSFRVKYVAVITLSFVILCLDLLVGIGSRRLGISPLFASQHLMYGSFMLSAMQAIIVLREELMRRKRKNSSHPKSQSKILKLAKRVTSSVMAMRSSSFSRLPLLRSPQVLCGSLMLVTMQAIIIRRAELVRLKAKLRLD
nr:hypothetical protein HK105_001388 [Polyrhizophydium stewartii]